MKDNYSPSLALLLAHEGGYVDNPHDAGGPTNKGITQRVYDDWRRAHGLALRSVRSIGDAEVSAIYRAQYWNIVAGDYLPAGIDYATFDFAVNSGTDRAARFLQRAASVTADGMIGPVTISAVETLDPFEAIDALCDLRLGYLEQLPQFVTFGTGWMRRVSDVRVQAKAMAA